MTRWIRIDIIFFGIMIILFLMFSLTERRKYEFQGVDKVPHEYLKKTNKSRDSKLSKENACRQIFEKLFRVSFPTCRPDFLKNPETKRNLELDGFCPTIPTYIGRGLAFEYDGLQHYSEENNFHKNSREFENQIKRDVLKDSLCKKHGVLLIRIPHWIHKKHLEKWIKKNLRNKGVL